MPIPLETDDIEKVDEPLRDYFVQDEEKGVYRLEVEGLPDVSGLKSALQKEREEAKRLKKQQQEIAKQWEGYDREEIDDLMARRAELEAAADPKKIETEVEKRIKQNNDTWESKFDELQNQNKSLFGELAKHRVRDRLMQVGAKSGINESAMEDYLARGERIFQMAGDGDVKPIDGKGEVLYGRDGVEPLTMEEFVKGLAETAPHLFKASSGGGASNSGGAGPIVRAKSDLKTVKDKADYIEEHGMEKYLQLPASRG